MLTEVEVNPEDISVIQQREQKRKQEVDLFLVEQRGR